MYKSFVESDFPTRSYLEHSKQVAEVEAFRRTKDNKDAIDPSKHYGINSRSMFMDIPLCDVTKVFPQDLMHTTIEGTLSLEICLLISHALERGKISLPRINERIAKFSKKFGCNKPARIDKDHIDRRRLHQTASETLSLAFMLPFVLRKKNMLTGKMESVCAEENLKCFIMRLELLDLQMSREITVTDVETIRAMTNEHHLMFQRLYPGEEIPKMHFETHYASQILLFGPLRYHWCFRYESKHSYFKKLYRALRSVKNLPRTLAENHQRHQAALMMLSAKGLQGPFLRENNSFGASVEKLLKAVPVTHQELLRGVFGGISSNTPIKVFKRCVIRGVKYTKGSAIISDFKETLPVFGEVVAFYRHDNQNAVVFKNMVTISYEAQLKAFKVGFVVGPFQLNVMKLSDFVYHHHLPFIKSVGANYVSVQCKSFHRK
ncbi:uncharacterized protein LOC117652867 [Thrips palmi]|uniref:Uncharacterized protein LOC117652867 n=1 Tax=Thrips palmi TaxID=161013 RepID=A0A6P9A8S6_THRPL|nr:uncharacterized protein LOC117652867 [Thrips palmi]